MKPASTCIRLLQRWGSGLSFGCPRTSYPCPNTLLMVPVLSAGVRAAVSSLERRGQQDSELQSPPNSVLSAPHRASLAGAPLGLWAAAPDTPGCGHRKGQTQAGAGGGDSRQLGRASGGRREDEQQERSETLRGIAALSGLGVPSCRQGWVHPQDTSTLSKQHQPVLPEIIAWRPGRAGSLRLPWWHLDTQPWSRDHGPQALALSGPSSRPSSPVWKLEPH